MNFFIVVVLAAVLATVIALVSGDFFHGHRPPGRAS